MWGDLFHGLTHLLFSRKNHHQHGQNVLHSCVFEVHNKLTRSLSDLTPTNCLRQNRPEQKGNKIPEWKRVRSLRSPRKSKPRINSAISSPDSSCGFASAACWSAKPDRLLAVEFEEKRGRIRISVIPFCNSPIAGFALGVCRGRVRQTPGSNGIKFPSY